MNIKKRLEHLAHMSLRDRQFGKTTLIAKMVKETDGILITHNIDFARTLERKHGIVAKSMEVNLEGLSGPFFFDHHAVETLLMKAVRKIEELEKENAQLKAKVAKAMDILGG